MKFLSLILLSLLILPSMAQAGSARRFMGVNRGVPNWTVSNQINGLTGISNSGPTSTGTQRGVTGAGPISAVVECNNGDDWSSIYLKVDGEIYDELVCDFNAYITGFTLTHTVEAGPHSVSIYGFIGGGQASFSATSFSIPLP